MSQRSIILLILAVLCSTASLSQPLKPGEWRTYTSMTNVADILVNQDSSELWVATSGGLYRVPLASVDNAHVTGLRNSDGLRDNSCSALARGPSGDIFVGDSSGGISIFHPSSGTFDIVTDIASSSQFPHRQISKLLVDDSILYVCTGFGLSLYDLKSGVFTQTVTRFGNWTLQDTVFDVTIANDTIYTIVNGAVAYAPRHSSQLSAPFAWTLVDAPQGVSLRSITYFHGKIVVGSMQGLWTLNGDTLAFIPVKDSVSIARFAQDKLGNVLYAADARGNTLLSTTDLAQFTVIAFPRNSLQKTVTALAVTASGVRISGFNGGGITIDDGTTPMIGFSPDGPLTNDVTDLQFAQGGRTLYSLYGTNGLTLFRPDDGSWQLFPANNAPLPHVGYTRIFYDSVRSTLWAGAFGEGLFAFKFSPSFSVTRFTDTNGFPILYPSTVISQRANLDNQGNLLVPLWAADGRSLLISKDAITFNPVQLNPPGGWRPYGSAIQDLDGYYYVATQSWNQPEGFGISVVIPSGGDTSVTLIYGGSGGQLASGSIDAMVVDQDNGLWCGMNVGVQVVSHSRDFQTGALQFRARTLRFLDQQIVSSIAVDGVGNKWVGTQDGVFVVSPDGTDSLAHFTTANSPLIDNTITAIALDVATGEAYFSTPKGISRTSSVFKAGEPDYKTIRIYPNPLVQDGDDPVSLTVTGMKQGSSLLVLTPSGRRVATIDATQLGSTVRWNCRDENNKLLPSGVYLVGAVSSETDVTEFGMTKFVLVRK
ncbi:MAG: hypothetical protein JSS75_03505 [Bacteroidetes bacterium]|nr:hypothetical protein [Bacteroidota bacterium]